MKLVKDEEAIKVRGRAKDAAEERLLDLLLPRAAGRSFTDRPGEPASAPPSDATREKLRAMLRDGKLDDREVEVELADDSNPADVGARRAAGDRSRTRCPACRTCSASSARRPSARS